MTNNLNELLFMSEIKMIVGMFKDNTNYDLVNNKMNNISFIDSECQKFYEIMRNMYDKMGYLSIDRIALIGYCDRVGLNKDEILPVYDTMFTIDSVSDFDGVFEEYSIISSIYKFHTWVSTNGGIDGVTDKLLKLNNMQDVNQVIEGRLLEFFNTGTADASIRDTNITDIIDNKFIESIKNKEEIIETVPLLKQFYILNSITKGMVRGVTGLGGWSGEGKTSMMYSVYVLSLLENTNSKICIYANEQTAKVFLIGLVFAFISQVINMNKDKYGEPIFLSRDKFISGKYNEDETTKFVTALKVFKKLYHNRITHAFFEDMTPNALKRDVRKKVKKGYKYFFYDTFKDNDEDYSKLMRLASTLDQLTKKYPIHAFTSLQLNDESKGTKYLTNKCLASAKGIKRILETLVLFRRLDVTELPYLKVHKLGHPNETIALNLENKNYVALFIDKARNGSSDVVLLYEVYLDILKYKEIGIISNMPKDDFRNYKKK